jgi:hypothetical protein
MVSVGGQGPPSCVVRTPSEFAFDGSEQDVFLVAVELNSGQVTAVSCDRSLRRPEWSVRIHTGLIV